MRALRSFPPLLQASRGWEIPLLPPSSSSEPDRRSRLFYCPDPGADFTILSAFVFFFACCRWCCRRRRRLHRSRSRCLCCAPREPPLILRAPPPPLPLPVLLLLPLPGCSGTPLTGASHWKLTPSPKWLRVRPPRAVTWSHSLRAAWELVYTLHSQCTHTALGTDTHSSLQFYTTPQHQAHPGGARQLNTPLK